ncbi:MAG: hypothetical protein KC502_01985 [Myxococcales bacterium]|nr:hypothetical protein [Myxococcales bacterium]
MNALSRLPRFLLILSCIAAFACGSDETGETTPTGAKLSGSFSASVDGSDVTVDYAGGKLVAELVHKINTSEKGYGCITSVFLSVAKADGSCALELTYQPGAGDGLALSKASFFAVGGDKQGGILINPIKCAGFPGAEGNSEVEWTLAGGDSNLSVKPVKPGEANKKSASLADQDLKLSGKIKLKKGGKLFELDLSSIRIQGTLTSVGSTQVSCGTAKGVEVCPKGVTYGNKVGTYVRRPLGAYHCTDDSIYDPGELCGSPAQVLVAYQHWVTEKDNYGGKDVLGGLGKTVTNTKDLGVIFVVLTGKQKVVVKNAEGKFEASGPAPTQADCAEIKKLYNLPDSVVMLYDKDKALTSTEKMPVGAGFTPGIAVASSTGKIVQLLPDSAGKMDQGMLDAAIQAAVDAE